MSAPSLLDKAKFYAIAGAGFFADGYLNLSISTGTLVSVPRNDLTN